MSKQRRLTSADVSASKKAPHGGRQCRWCKAEVFPPRQTYCSDACVHAWKLRSDVGYLRSQLFLRDKGICKMCGLDTQALRLKMYPLNEDGRERLGLLYWFPVYNARNLMLWEADHIVAVSNGGGLSGLDNFQTLCVPCHRNKTKQDLR